ncbi:MAG TPA: DUF499 domain-containing protein [Thermoanaerobaculia bacterium]
MIKPWYKVITPREDLRDGRPLDASEFAVHLDHVRDGRAPAVYQQPEEFFERTYLTKNLRDLAVQVARRLNGVRVETSAIFNLSTQFGGGKTHALTLLWHLARGGAEARRWKGVSVILDDANVTAIPPAATAVFVGTEFDSLTGRGGMNGEPLRRTPWAEIAWQLGGAQAFALVEEHERTMTSPGGDVIERMLPAGTPALILLDELMNYMSRNRKSGLATQLYNFVQNLSEVARSRPNVVLAVSIPASEMEMTAEDQADFDRMKKLLDRLGKAMIMSAEAETAEIIRRRLFEWGALPKEANETIDTWSGWVIDHKELLPRSFPAEQAAEQFRASYPFHPSLLSVFERKWQALPRFQQTRGVLRLLALWVSRAYAEGYKGAHKDPLISLGTAPLDDALFRAAVFEQLGEGRLEPAVTTDIIGKDFSHAVRLDTEGTAEIRKARLHRKIATTILFESNGGQQKGEATLGEVRLAVGEPGLDIGNVEQCLEALAEACYFLTIEKNRYRFSIQPNLNKLLSDRRATVAAASIDERVRGEIQKVFGPAAGGVERVFFPEKSNQIADRPALTFVILHPDHAASAPSTSTMMTTITAESGQSSRTFKSALIFCVADDVSSLREEARKLLAWEEIEEDAGELKLDESQQRQLVENRKRAERDLRESVWRSYRHVFYLGANGEMSHMDLGLIHSSPGTLLAELILARLKDPDIVVTGVSPSVLTRNWPPALPEWSTRAVRDAFYSSPRLPRLLRAESLKDTISKGLDAGVIAYVSKRRDGDYEPFVYKRSLLAAEVEFSDEVFLITREMAENYLASKSSPSGVSVSPAVAVPPPSNPTPTVPLDTPAETERTTDSQVVGFGWAGIVPHQKWTNFYTRVLSRFVGGGNVTIHVSVDVRPETGVAMSKLDEVRIALRELGLDEKIVIHRDEP